MWVAYEQKFLVPLNQVVTELVSKSLEEDISAHVLFKLQIIEQLKVGENEDNVGEIFGPEDSDSETIQLQPICVQSSLFSKTIIDDTTKVTGGPHQMKEKKCNTNLSELKRIPLMKYIDQETVNNLRNKNWNTL